MQNPAAENRIFYSGKSWALLMYVAVWLMTGAYRSWKVMEILISDFPGLEFVME